ncbi:MAG: flagellar motor switch protein FliG [Oligoflexia bacterium]|nr:flagellar motor switch protein FliG [Oligoflexia bacterium]
MSLFPESYEELTGLHRAALLMNVLGPQCSKKIFGQLKDNDIKRLLGTMSLVEKAPVTMVKRVLEAFFFELSEEEALIFGNAKGKSFILETLGEERAKHILGNVGLQDGAKTLEALELVDTRTLSNFLVNEHPQTIALIVAHLDPIRKSDTIKRLPDSLQGEVTMRLANIDFISPELIAQLDDVLKSELATVGTIDSTSLGGVEPVAEMLNTMDKTTETNIMARVEEKDPELAEEIKKLMFVFEDLVALDDRGMQSLLKEVPNDKLLIALKTSPEEIKQKIFKNMSTRASQLLQEDLANLGPQRLSDVESAQSEIVNIAKRLEGEGKIQINRGGGDTFV